MRLKQLLMASMVALAGLFWVLPATAADFDRGFEAYRSGDYEVAFAEWMPLAKQGYVGAQFNIAVTYERGQGITRDDAEALKWYRLAAEQEYARAQYNIGVIHAKGEGVPKDYTAAYAWFNMAAANGYKGCSRTFPVTRRAE